MIDSAIKGLEVLLEAEVDLVEECRWTTFSASSVIFLVVAEEAEADAVEVATEPEPDEPVEPGDDAGADSFAGGAASTGTHANSFVWSDSTARSSSAANEVTFGAAGNLRVLGGNITQEAFGLLQGERAAVPAAPGAGNGYWWIRNDVPNAFSPTRRIRLGAAAFTV